MIESKRALPLTMVGPGQRVQLVAVSAGQNLTHRLAEMGLTPGVDLEVVQDAGGPLLIAVRDTRLAVGRGMAHAMMVRFAE